MTAHGVAQVERHILGRAHRALEGVLVRIETTAGLAGQVSGPELTALVLNLLDALERTLPTHMEWEESVCFEETDRLAGTAWATRILRAQHEQIRRRVQRLGDDARRLGAEGSPRTAITIRGQLYELHAVLASHLEQEEHVLLGLLVAVPGARAGSD